LKGDLKVNLEPKWFLRRSWKFHVSDFWATLLFTSYCAHVLITFNNYSGALTWNPFFIFFCFAQRWFSGEYWSRSYWSRAGLWAPEHHHE
jgi:hypothetical protein